MRAELAACHPDGDSIRIAWDLPGSALAYALVAIPTEDATVEHAFFGHSHYVEVQDQIHGHYGGLEHLAVLDDHAVLLRLKQPVAGAGTELIIRTMAPMGQDVLAQLRRAEALVGGRGV